VLFRSMKPDGIKSLDMSLFLDPVDGQAYFVRSCDNKYVGISRLTKDYLSSTGMISNHSVFEGMSLFRHRNGTYYMMTSHLTGWRPNPLMLFRAQGKTLDDPQWVDMGNPTGSNTSFNSQPTYVVEYTPKSGEPYFVYMADNWVHCPNEDGTEGPLINACYIWLPIQFHKNSVTMDYKAEWDLEDPFSLPGDPRHLLGVTCFFLMFTLMVVVVLVCSRQALQFEPSLPSRAYKYASLFWTACSRRFVVVVVVCARVAALQACHHWN